MDQRAELEWRDGLVPISTRFDDPYYSLENGVAETQHTFLGGNDLPARFRDGFHIAELGFGTGLNFLVTLQAWRLANVPGRLRFTSFEAYPMAVSDMVSARRAFPDLPPDLGHAGAGLTILPPQIKGSDFDLTIIQGDARQTLASWAGRADAWFLDGFAPAKNPELWGVDLMAQVGAHTALGGTCATYTAAGHVRRALEHAGFAITRTPGYGRKRHMTKGVKA